MCIHLPAKTVLLACIAMATLVGCASTSIDPTQKEPDIIVERTPDHLSAPITEKAFIDGDRLVVQYSVAGKLNLAEAELPLDQERSQRGAYSLYLQQAIQVNNGLPVAQLVSSNEPSPDNVIAEAREIPIASPLMWREFRTRLISAATPRNPGQGIVIEFLKEDELFFYYDENGILTSSRLSKKPSGFSIEAVYKFRELVLPGLSSLDEYISVSDNETSYELLFDTGDSSAWGYPFVYLNQNSEQIVFLRRTDTNEDCCEKTGTMLPQALVHTTDSHITGILKQPVGSIARLFTLVLNQLVDTLTPKPLAILDHKPIPTIYQQTPMDPEKWELTLDSITNSSLSQGSMEYLVDGAMFFPRLFDAIQSAQQSIDIRIYIFDNDHYALQIADLLKRKSSEVKVRVLMDGIGSFGAASTSPTKPISQNPRLPNIIRYLKQDSEIEVRLVDNHWLAGDHSKTILIDNRIAFLGGMNLGREYRYEWHDLMVELKGPIVDEIQHEFEKAWRLQSYLGDIRAFFYRSRDPINQPEPADIPIRLLLSRPGDSKILRAQLAAIERAKQRIYIQNAYFTSDDILYELAKARRRGVDVRVIIPYQSDSGVISRSNVIAMNKMLANGIRVFIYPKESHIKGAIYDGWICLGSSNFDRLSLRVNKELNIATSDPTAVGEFLDKIIYPDMQLSVELKEPLTERWSDFLMEMMADQL